jgi:hypothetical protein
VIALMNMAVNRSCWHASEGWHPGFFRVFWMPPRGAACLGWHDNSKMGGTSNLLKSRHVQINTLSIFIFCLFFAILQPAKANDSAGTTAAGGIILQKTNGVAMTNEHLQISKDQVMVDYIFQNITGHDITTQVIFPLPAYYIRGANETWDSEINPHLNPKTAPLANFTVTVNSQPVAFQTISRAIYQGHDITQQLQQAGIPLNPELIAGSVPVMDMNQITQWQTKAKKLGLLNTKNHPLWQKQVFYQWTQTFPAHKTLQVHHQYRPSSGTFYSVSMPNNPPAILLKADQQRITDLFSLNLAKLQQGADFKKWLNQRNQAASHLSTSNCFNYQPSQTSCMYAMFYNVDYILHTGANWAGPIQQFTLTIHYPPTGTVAYNAFYTNHATKIQQHSGLLQLRLTNFTPTRDLHVLFGIKPKNFNPK